MLRMKIKSIVLLLNTGCPRLAKKQTAFLKKNRIFCAKNHKTSTVELQQLQKRLTMSSWHVWLSRPGRPDQTDRPEVLKVLKLRAYSPWVEPINIFE